MKVKLILGIVIISLILMLSVPEIRTKVYKTLFYEKYELGNCKGMMILDKRILSRIDELLKQKNEKADTYFASKHVYQYGERYNLLINFPSTSLVIAASSMGISSREISPHQGRELFESFINAGYKDVKDDYGGNLSHGTCEVYRVFDSENFYDFTLLNSTGRTSISSEANLKKVTVEFFNNEIEKHHGQSYEFKKFPDSNRYYDDSEYEVLEQLLDEDVFFELSNYVDIEN